MSVPSLLAWNIAFISIVATCAPTAVSGADPDTVVVLNVTAELRAPSGNALADDEFDVAGRTVRALLETAGIVVDWRDCRRRDLIVKDPPGSVSASEVRLRPASRPNVSSVAKSRVTTLEDPSWRLSRTTCGPGTAFRFHVASRSNPALGDVRVGQLVGLTLAHEVGHWLGLPHAPSGVMKARPALEEVTDLVAQRLAFAGAQDRACARAADSVLRDRRVQPPTCQSPSASLRGHVDVQLTVGGPVDLHRVDEGLRERAVGAEGREDLGQPHLEEAEGRLALPGPPRGGQQFVEQVVQRLFRRIGGAVYSSRLARGRVVDSSRISRSCIDFNSATCASSASTRPCRSKSVTGADPERDSG